MDENDLIIRRILHFLYDNSPSIKQKMLNNIRRTWISTASLQQLNARIRWLENKQLIQPHPSSTKKRRVYLLTEEGRERAESLIFNGHSYE